MDANFGVSSDSMVDVSGGVEFSGGSSENSVEHSMFVVATKIIEVPFSDLVRSVFNVRKSEPKNIAELALNIEAVGVLQNLVVHEIKSVVGKGKSAKTSFKYGVVAGLRRFSALALLLEQGKIEASYPVQVKVVDDKEALLISLTENYQREGMHPADQIDAFKMLIEEGRSVAYIASVFGLSELAVKQRAKLGNLSNKLVELLREDKITLEQMQALALTDDHEKQETVWFGSAEYERQAWQLRRKIAGEALNIAGSHTFKFVGAEAFEKAGGVIIRDLFARDKDGYITDVGLLEQLATEKMHVLAEAENIAVNEWAWVRVIPRIMSYDDTMQYSRLRQEMREPTDDEAAELARIEAEYDRLQEALEQDEDENSLSEAFEALDEQKEKLEAALLVWSDAAKAQAGVILSITGSGELQATFGMVKPGEKISEASDEGTPSHAKKIPVKALHSEKLVQRLSAHRTAAVRAELIKQPDVALVVLTHRLVCNVFTERWNNVSSVIKASFDSNIHEIKNAAPDLSDSHSWTVFEAAMDQWQSQLPENYTQSYEWLLAWPQSKVIELLAFAMSSSVNGLQTRDSKSEMDALVRILRVDMNQYWEPTQSAYFDHINKNGIVWVVTEAVSAEKALPLATMKKGDAAAVAAGLVSGTGWLPITFREAVDPVNVEVVE